MEPTAVQTVEAVELSWPVGDLLPLVEWGSIALLCGFAIGLLALLRMRKKDRAQILWLSAASLAVCLATWYLYPSVAYKGTYVATYDYAGNRQTSVVAIGDEFIMDERVLGVCRVNPLQRILWVSLPDGWLEDSLPVKLGWNRISVPTPKVGWVDYKRQRK